LNGNATVQFIYTGGGEVSTRPVQLATTLNAARIHRIDASGSGALVLDNFQNTSTGNFAMLFELRGANTDNNRINSVIADGVGGLNLLKGDGGVWILGNSNNTFTGGVRVDGGCSAWYQMEPLAQLDSWLPLLRQRQMLQQSR
jgi:autotransporter-associated beta strand protein